MTQTPSPASRPLRPRQALALAACAALAGLFVGGPAAALAQEPHPAVASAANPLPEPDRQFVQDASVAGSTEIDAAKLAMTRSDDRRVRSFASHMVLDHTRLAAQLQVAVPTGVSAPIDNPDTALLNSIRDLKGAAFDQAYVSKLGLEGHRQALALFEQEAHGGQNERLRRLANEALPTIREHLKMAQDLARERGMPVGP